ncbi:hypothetical protein ACROYT_G035796 [Oculina patagonica]
MLKDSFEGHKVTPVKEFKEEDYEALLKRQSFCSQQFHEKKITRFFCVSCQDCVCQICFVTDHRNHDFLLLDKAAHGKKPNIMSGAEMIKDKISELGEVIRKFEDTLSKLEIKVATAKHGVSKAAEQMIAEIREREREAIVLLETTRVTRLERINSAMQDAQSLVKQMKQAVEFAKNLAERSSSSDIMRNKETLKERFEVLRAVEVPKNDETSFIKFTAVFVEDLKLGFIETTDKYRVDVNRSTLEGMDQALQAGVEAKFTLCPKTSEGELSNQADLKDQVEVLIEPAKDVTNVMVSEKEDGNLQLKFTPKVPGAYSIEVKINGDKLPTCPFTMQVKERKLAVVGELDLKFFQGDVPKGFYGIAINTKGKVVVTDYNGHCVYVFDNEGNCLRKIGSQGSNSGQFNFPGTVVKSFGKRGAGKGEFENPVDVCLDNEGRIVVTELGNHRIHVLSKEGETIFIFGDSGPEKLCRPRGCISYKNIFVVSDRNNNCIRAFTQSGTFMYKCGTQGNQDGQFKSPYGMLVDRSNNLLLIMSKLADEFLMELVISEGSLLRTLDQIMSKLAGEFLMELVISEGSLLRTLDQIMSKLAGEFLMELVISEGSLLRTLDQIMSKLAGEFLMELVISEGSLLRTLDQIMSKLAGEFLMELVISEGSLLRTLDQIMSKLAGEFLMELVISEGSLLRTLDQIMSKLAGEFLMELVISEGSLLRSRLIIMYEGTQAVSTVSNSEEC